MRALGLVERLGERPGLAGRARSTTQATCGSSLGSGRMRIRGRRTGRRSASSCRGSGIWSRRRWREGAAGADARLMVLGGDCTAHAGALAGLRAARPGARYAIAWFDAHGDFNTPDTTPSGNVWGMPFAMLLGRGDPDLVAAADGPTVMEQDAALFGGQVLDETESRMLAASRVAQFGAGMLGTEAGRAAVEGWARAVASRVDGIYIAFDMDCLDGAGGWAVTMPEPDGLALETAVAVIRILAAAMPVVGFGATGVTLANGDGAKTVDGAARLAEAAFAPR